MKNETEKKLDAVFDAYAARQTAAKQATDARKTKEQLNVEQFYALREAVIRPAMESIQKYLQAKGFKSDIENVEDGYDTADARRRPIEARVTLKLSVAPPPGSYSRTIERPHFAVILNKADSSVYFHESTMMPGQGGMAGGCGTARLDEITGDLIEAKIAETLGKIFK